MPFKSQAQRRKFAQLLVDGKISPAAFEEWNRETGSTRLPERVERKTTRARKAETKRKTSAKRRTSAKRKMSATRKTAKTSTRKRTRR
jgi:hypothetical protein